MRYLMGELPDTKKQGKIVPALLQEKTWKRVLQSNASSPGQLLEVKSPGLIYWSAQV